MGKIDLNTKIEAVTEGAPEQDGLQLVEWKIRANTTGSDSGNTMDNGCGCDCGCDEMA